MRQHYEFAGGVRGKYYLRLLPTIPLKPRELALLIRVNPGPVWAHPKSFALRELLRVGFVEMVTPSGMCRVTKFGIRWMALRGMIERPMFVCKLCGARHPTDFLMPCGVYPMPDSATTERDKDGAWFVRCVKCPQ